VRLKGGDPLVLSDAGAKKRKRWPRVELTSRVVPGITSAIAAPAYAGIPVTHRDQNSHVTFFTGHEDPTKGESAIDFDALAKLGGTQVMLMGMDRLAAITREMLSHGSRKDLPVALIRLGTVGQQKTIVGILENIAERASAVGLEAPAVAIFGDVVSLRKNLNWFENRPLFGKRIVVTRTRKQASGLSSQLRALGADVIQLPTIRIEPPSDLREFAGAGAGCAFV
jgi:uroporphyrinogen III methyltransferase/synthase